MTGRTLRAFIAISSAFLFSGCTMDLNIHDMLSSPALTPVTTPENTELPTSGTVAKKIELRTTIALDAEEDAQSSIQASNGKIYTVGKFKSAPAMWASNPDGSRDTSFGTNGYIKLKVANENFRSRTSITVVGTRLLVTSGIQRYFENTAETFSFLRIEAFNLSGTVDVTFADNGLFEIKKTAQIHSDGVAEDSLGRLYLPYYTRDTVPARSYLVRLSSAGTLDASFGSAGITSLPVIETALDSFVNGITLDESDNIILHGTYGSTKSMLWKVDPTGVLVNSFGTNGIVDLNVMPEIAAIRYANNKLWIAHHNGPNGHFRGVSAITRLNSNGSIDTTFNGSGRLVLSTLGGKVYSDTTTQNVDIVGFGNIESDGSVLVVAEGATYACYGCDILERTSYAFIVTNSGAVDTNYGVSGYVSNPHFLTDQRGQLILKQTDGSYILPLTIGRYENSTQKNMGFWKLNSTGIDTTFGTNGMHEWSEVTTFLEYDLTDLISTEADAIYVTSAFERGRLAPVTYLKKYSLDGDLINSFGTNGVLELSNRNINSVFIIKGNLYLFDTSFKLVSYTLSGQPRTTWGNGGEIQAFPGYTIDNAIRVTAIDHQDGIVLVANHTQDYSSEGIIMQRLTSSGSPDASWGSNGIRYTPTTIKSLSELHSFPVANDGSFFLAYEEYEGTLDILKFNASGALETNFATAGALQFPHKTDSWNKIEGLAVANNHLYLNLSKKSVDGNWSGNCFSRYTLEGVLDTAIPGGEWCTDTLGKEGENSSVISFRIIKDDSLQILYEWFDENTNTEGKAFNRYKLSTGALEFSKDFSLDNDSEYEESGYFTNNLTYLSIQFGPDELESIILYK